MAIRVLIADDSQHSREALGALIGLEPDFELVGAAADAEEAITLASQHAPDVAIVDVRMPGGGRQESRGRDRPRVTHHDRDRPLRLRRRRERCGDVRGRGGRVRRQGRTDRSGHRSDPARGSQAEEVRSARAERNSQELWNGIS